MNKGELVAAIATRLEISKADAARFLDAAFGCIRSGVDADGRVGIAGFGTFRKKLRKARTSVNPATGQLIEIKAFTTVGFTPSEALRNGVATEV
jgi:DNA-binding protein HU-beta